jgi:hypothetical protein
LCCELRFGVRHAYTLGSENEFVDVETFSDIVLEAQGNLGDSPFLLRLRLVLPMLLMLMMRLIQNLLKIWSRQ